MRMIVSCATRNLVLAVTLAGATALQATVQDKVLAKVITALDRPVSFNGQINKRLFGDVLDELQKKIKVEIKIDTEAFKKQLGRKDIAKSKVSFDRTGVLTASLFLDIFLRQLDAHFETRDGTVWIVPMTDQHNVYHPPCLRLEEQRRTKLVRAKLQHPVNLDNCLERMTFGEAKEYFQDRFDLTILVDQGLFPKAAKPVSRRLIELPAMADVPLEKVLNQLVEQLDVDMEIRGGAVLIVPKEAKK